MYPNAVLSYHWDAIISIIAVGWLQITSSAWVYDDVLILSYVKNMIIY